MEKWIGVMKYMGSVVWCKGKWMEVMKCMRNVNAVYGDMDVGNGLVRIMMLPKMEKQLGGEKLIESHMCRWDPCTKDLNTPNTKLHK